jgi:hypothetical protein
MGIFEQIQVISGALKVLFPPNFPTEATLLVL